MKSSASEPRLRLRYFVHVTTNRAKCRSKVAACKGIQDSHKFRIPVLDSGFQSPGFWIHSKNLLDSGFHKRRVPCKFPQSVWIRIPLLGAIEELVVNGYSDFITKFKCNFFLRIECRKHELALNNQALEFCVQPKFTRKSQVLEVYLYLERSRTFFFLKKVLHVSQFIFHETWLFSYTLITSNSWHYSCPRSVYSILAPCVPLWNRPIHNEDVHTYSIQ